MNSFKEVAIACHVTGVWLGDSSHDLQTWIVSTSQYMRSDHNNNTIVFMHCRFPSYIPACSWTNRKGEVNLSHLGTWLITYLVVIWFNACEGLSRLKQVINIAGRADLSGPAYFQRRWKGSKVDRNSMGQCGSLLPIRVMEFLLCSPFCLASRGSSIIIL